MIKKLGNSGLTLIEVIIAMTILSIIMVSVISVTNTSLDQKEVIVQEDREILQIESALDRLEWDFSQIYSPLFYSREFTIDPKRKEETTEKFKKLRSNQMYASNGNYSMPNYYGHPIPIFKQDTRQSFEFYTKGHRRKIADTKESNFAWVKYEFRDSTNEDDEREGDFLELVRYYVARDIYNNELRVKDTKPYILAENITDFQFSFWDPKREKWTNDLRDVDNGDRLVRGFKVSLTWQRASGGEEVTERVFRSLWPYFEAEDMNEERYKGVDGQGEDIGEGNEGDGDEDGDEGDEDEES